MKIELTKEEAHAILSALAGGLEKNNADAARVFVFFENLVNKSINKEENVLHK